MKILKFNEFSNLHEDEISLSEPVGVAVLGAPAGGKSYWKKKLQTDTEDARLVKTLTKGVDLTVDKLRGDFLSKKPADQLEGFLAAFYSMRDRADSNSAEYGKWFNDIKNLWANKIAPLSKSIKITVDNDDIYFDGKSALDNFAKVKELDAEQIISSLDNYEDYKRVVRHFQGVTQGDAIKKLTGVSYDEAGDEPTKIVSNMDKLHKQGYVTDIFLIHPTNIASNIIQNYKRVVTGGDDGRDSSAAIVNAFLDIEASKDIYAKSAERTVKIAGNDTTLAKTAISKANVPDDESRGNKPVDVLVEIEPMKPSVAYRKFSTELEPGQKKVFDALLKYGAQSIKNIPPNAKLSLEELTKHMSNKEAMTVLKDAAASGKYKFKFGGVTDELVHKAQDVLK